MIRSAYGTPYASILDALVVIRSIDKDTQHITGCERSELSKLRAHLDAIIASAQGAVSAAGLPESEVLDRATGRAAA